MTKRATYLVFVLFATTCCIAFFAFWQGANMPKKYFPKSHSATFPSYTPHPVNVMYMNMGIAWNN